MPLSAMNSRRTSFAPSNIRLMRESRRIRSYGYGFTYPRPPASCTMSSAALHTISLAKTFAQAASSGTVIPALSIPTAAHTALTASTEWNALYLNGATNTPIQFATGALATERFMRIDAPTYAFVGASTITNAASFTAKGVIS